MPGYSWTDNTKNWKKSGKYKFDSARKPYIDKLAAASAARGGRSYVMNRIPDSKVIKLKGKEISSESTNPIIIAVDVTGSMETTPGDFFDRAPLLYQTLSQYRDDVEICFSAIGDANSDQYPLQVNDFAKGIDLEDKIKAIGCEGNGGGQIHETYELFGYFVNNHCKLPKATMPFLFIYGDEKFYPKVNPDQVKHYIGDTLENEIASTQIWKSLMQKFNIFYLQKPYGYGNEPSVDKQVREYWVKALGPERVIQVPKIEQDPNKEEENLDRAVDVIMGIVAKYWGQYMDFSKSLDARQDSEVQNLVHKSIRYLPKDPNRPLLRASRMLGTGKGSASKRLDEI